MAAPVGAPAALLAGIVSFLSPCVLPLVPGYISFISGLSLEELKQGADRRKVMLDAGVGSLFFVAGFTVVFVLLGASASAAGRLLSSNLDLFKKAAGTLIVVFGLHTSGIMPIKWLYYTKKVSHGSLPPTRVGAFVMGLAFACGWTPCIGPILGSILALAATEETIARGMALLAIYSLGLGVPFVLTGFGVNAFLGFFSRYKRYIGWGEKAAGFLLIAVGVLVFLGRLEFLMRFMPSALSRFQL